MKNAALIISVVVLGEVVGAVTVKAQAQSKEQQQILALEQAIVKAIETGDAAAYDKLTADDFQFITGAGAVMTKAERLALLRKGPASGFAGSDHNIRLYGNVAVVTGRQGAKGTVRFTRVWVRSGSEWRAVVTQATGIQSPK